MARKIQFKRGLKANLPKLSPAEIAFTTDEKKLYVGDGNENIRLLDQKDKTELTEALAEMPKTVNNISPDETGNIQIPVPEVDTTKLATKQDIQQLSLTFKESYPTLAELQSAYPNGDNANHVVLADKMIYTYTNGWVSTGIQGVGTGIAEKSVSLKNVDFIKGYNLFNGKFSNSVMSNGTITTPNPNYRAVVIPSEPNKTYQIKTTGEHDRFTVAGSNTNKIGDPITTIVTKTTTGNEEYTFTNTTGYLYIWIAVSLNNKEPAVSVLDSTEFSIAGNIFVSKKPNEVSNEMLQNKAVTIKKTDFLEYLDNLFSGAYSTGKGIDVSGTNSAIIAVANGRMAIFEVEANKQYAVRVKGTFNRYVVTFTNSLDINTTTYPAIKSLTPTNDESITATNTNGYKYLIVYVSSTGQEPELYVSEGNEALTSPVIKINGNKLMIDPDEGLNLKRYSSYYEIEPVASGVPATFTELYTLYDRLLTDFPGYVTKEGLGTNAQGHELRSYKCALPNVKNDVGLTRYKVGILASIHGDEKNPAIATLKFLQDLCANPDNNEIIDKIKSSVDFYVIPTGNPTGWNNNSRGNGNAVDLNRNFTTGWTSITNPSTNNSGTGPASEKETQIIEKWLADNKFDAFIDFHNSAYGNSDYPDELSTLSWFSTAKDSHELPLKRLYSRVIGLMSTLWSKRYETFPKNTMFGYSRDLTSATAHIHAATLGAKSATLETSWKIGYEDATKYGTVTNTCATELLGNYVFEVCREYI